MVYLHTCMLLQDCVRNVQYRHNRNSSWKSNSVVVMEPVTSICAQASHEECNIVYAWID